MPVSSLARNFRDTLIKPVRPELIEGHSLEIQGFDRLSPNGHE
jgi:hypothetical protein